MHRTPSRPLRCVPWLAAAGLVALLTGCTQTAQPEPTHAQSSVAAPSPSTSATPAEPAAALQPDGTAQDNLPLFRQIVQRVAATDQEFKGRAYVDALVKAGFDKKSMQLTSDKTSVGHQADSIEFSVLWKGQCLVGEVGPSISAPAAVVLPQVPAGGCLIGNTVQLGG